MKFIPIILFVFICLFPGCASRSQHDYTAFYEAPPRSILVVPILNDTVELLAPNTLISSVTMPLAEQGYYVFPILLTNTLFQDLGLPEAGLIHQLSPTVFHERFGADSVLFITIKDWSSKYIGIQNTIHIEANYLLTDTRSGNVLWERTEEISKGSGGGGLAEMIVNAAVEKLSTEIFDSNYRPLAKTLNARTLTATGIGLPTGPYNPLHQTDQSKFPMKEKDISK